MQKLLSLTVFCLLLTASLVEAQRAGSRSAQPRLTVLPSQHSPAGAPGNVTGLIKADSVKADPIPSTGLTHSRSHVLLIGVNDYLPMEQYDESRSHIVLTGFPDLRFCRKDMEGLQDALVKGRFCNAEDIRILVSGTGSENEPTKVNVEKAFRELLSTIQRGDRVLVAFSGHGISLPTERDSNLSENFLCCADAKVSYNSTVGLFDTRQGVIAIREIESQLDRSAAAVKLFFVDACRNELTETIAEVSGRLKSDSVARSVAGRNVASHHVPVDHFGNYVRDNLHVQNPGLFRFSSANHGEKSYEYPGDVEHGAFTYFLIKGMLGEAEQFTPGRITLEDLESYVKRETQRFVTTRVGQKQRPILVPLPTQESSDQGKVLFSYPYKPGSEPAPVPVELPGREPVQIAQAPAQPAPRPTRQEEQRQRQEEQRQQQEELRRQRDLIAQRNETAFSNFATESANRVQEVAVAPQQTNNLQDIRNEYRHFINTRPQGTLTPQQIDTWHQTGRRLQRDMDTWMTSTNPNVRTSPNVTFSFSSSESAAARRAAGYNTTGGSGNRSGAGR